MKTNIRDYFENSHRRGASSGGPKGPKPRRFNLTWIKAKYHQAFDWINTHRLIAIGGAALILLSVFIPFLSHIISQDKYKLSDATLGLVGKTDKTLAKQLTYDGAKGLYQFNADAVKSFNPMDAMQAQVGTVDGKQDKSLYALDVHKDMAKGVTYHDINSQLSFDLVPQFEAGSKGQLEQGHLVFPMDGNSQAVYTLKNNGLKEDIVVQKATSDQMSFSYDVKLPKTLEAKMLPDGSGGIGIYGADPSLLGNMSYGSSKDQALVEKAREKAKKTNLVFGLPAPVIEAANGSIGSASAKFILQGSTLQVSAKGLTSIDGAFTIDPSVVVTSASDFETGGNNEGNIDFSTSDQVTRGSLTGGSVGTWATTNDISSLSGNAGQKVESTGSTIYNSYMYIAGGIERGTSTKLDDVRYALLGSNGTVGTWNTTTSLPTTSLSQGLVAYNGYMYNIGGNKDTTAAVATIYYAPINADGTLGSWDTTVSLPTELVNLGATASDGYMYVAGGSTVSGSTGSFQSTVYYAPINADGTLGSWSTTTALSYKRTRLSAVAYNGYLYIGQGSNNSPSFVSDVQYAAIKSDGSLGSWVAASNSFAGARYGGIFTAYNGYMYVYGGWSGGYPVNVQYAPIRANGDIGSWRSSSSFTNGRKYLAGGVYNGYLYIGTGFNGSSNYNDMQYAKIDPPGINTPFTTTGATSLPAGRQYTSAAAYNGYLYILGGGGNASGYGNRYDTVAYAPLNSDGTVGSWTTSSNKFVSATGGCVNGAATQYHGYLYYMGGYCAGNSDHVQYAPINSDGSVGSWTSTTSLNIAKTGLNTWAYNGYLYEAGGYHSVSDTACSTIASKYCQDVRYTPINSDGSIGSWTATTSLPFSSSTGMYALWSNYVYWTGGDGSTTSSSGTTHYARMNTDGTLTSWTHSTNNTYRSASMMGSSNGYLYIWGDKSNGGVLRSTGEYAKIESDGAIAADSGCGDSWCPMQNLTTTTISYSAGVIYNGYLYAYGGTDGTNPAVTTGQVSAINNGGSGTVGTWTSSPHNFANGRYTHDTVAYNGYLYVLGGRTPSTSTIYSGVQYTKIEPDGDVAAWQNTASLPSSLYSLKAVAYNGFMYVMGGNNGSSKRDSVYYAAINSDGTLGSWRTTSQFTTGRSTGAAVAYNGYMYIYGGVSTVSSDNCSLSFCSDVQFASIKADGSLGDWNFTHDSTNDGSTYGGGLPSGRYGLGGIVYNGYLYAIGGTTPPFGSAADVLYAKIANDGTVGAWNPTASFPVEWSVGAAVAQNGYVYVLGGKVDGTTNKEVWYASINQNGTLGKWTTTSSFYGARYSHAAAAADGYVYITGGYGGGSYKSGVQYAPLSSIARTGRYSKLIDFGGAINVTDVTLSGIVPDNHRLVTYKAAGSDGEFGPNQGSIDNIKGGITGCIGTTPDTRYLFISAVLDDSNGQGQSGSFPDTDGTAAQLNDIIVTYHQSHPAPDIRLRAGQTLQEGNLSALDTCRT